MFFKVHFSEELFTNFLFMLTYPKKKKNFFLCSTKFFQEKVFKEKIFTNPVFNLVGMLLIELFG
jgi:hypothetical protein